jgi:hypothetical protein
VKRTQREVVDRWGIAYTVVTWDDETGDAEILEFDDADSLIRRRLRTYRPDGEQRGVVVGEEVSYDPVGNELDRRLLRASPPS